MAAQRQSSERLKAAVKLRVDSGLCFAQEVQPPGYNSVAGRLDELAGLLGCVTRHKHLAGRLGKGRLCKSRFGKCGLATSKVRTRCKAFVAGAVVAVIAGCKVALFTRGELTAITTITAKVGATTEVATAVAAESATVIRTARCAISKVAVVETLAWLRLERCAILAAVTTTVVAVATEAATANKTTAGRLAACVATTTAAEVATAAVRTVAEIATWTLWRREALPTLRFHYASNFSMEVSNKI